MSFTSNCDIYAAVHDNGINRVIKHLMRKRPSLFNYGTSLLVSNPDLFCKHINADPEVIQNANPLATTLGPLPVIGMNIFPGGSIGPTGLALNFGAQLSKGEIDFFRGNVFTLPPELGTLANQRMAVHFQVCAGIGYPKEIVRPGHIIRPPIATQRFQREQVAGLRVPPDKIRDPNQVQEITLPTSGLECFCLDLYATAGCSITGSVGNQKISPHVDGIEIVDLKPVGLENALECYAKLVLNSGILPPVSEFISSLAFGLFQIPSTTGDFQISGNIQLSAATAVANNPAIEDDQLKVFVNIDTLNLNILVTTGSGGGGGGGGGGSGGTVTRTIRPRTRTGVFDLTAAMSEKAFKKVYGAVIDGFRFSSSDSGSYSIFTASYSVAAHLNGGTIDLETNGSIRVSDLEVKWDTLYLDLGIDIPTITIGGFCILWVPVEGCIIEAPSIDLFSASPDISVPLDLSGLITSEVTFSAIPKVFYGVGSGVPNRWQITLVPTLPILLDIIDIADTVGDLFHNLITNAIDNLLNALGLPGWAVDFIDSVLGGVEGIIRTVLDIPDDVAGFILDLIGNLGIFQALIDAISQYIAITLFELEDPKEILPGDPAVPLIPVRLPIEFLDIHVDSNGSELVIHGDIGD